MQAIMIIKKKSKLKMSKSHMGKLRGTPSAETKRKISESNKGKLVSNDNRRKLSLAVKGKPWSKARREAQERKSLVKF